MKKKLENIILVWVDSQFKRISKVFEICENYFDFADKKIITQIENNRVTESGIQVISQWINSIEEYSYFMMKELYKYIETDYVLIVQYDGFILNPDAWTDEFLEYDYIWAPWWYTDSHNVGNWGFSLRSKKLLELLATDRNLIQLHPEDHHICRTYWEYLISKWIRFAPEELAKKFSIEWSLTPPILPVKYWSKWTNEFGFHGLQDTDLSQWSDWNNFFPEKYNIDNYVH